MTKKISFYLFITLLSFGIFTSACKDPEDDGGEAKDIEEMALSPEWNTYMLATASELLDDCIALWAAWNGPEGLSDDEKARLGADFFTKNADRIGTQGYAKLFSGAGPNNTHEGLKSQQAAIEMIVSDGCIVIAEEVGEAKIGEPKALADDGRKDEAVLEVESWYSWNSIADFADNIVSIKNSYWGGRDLSAASATGISTFVKSKNPALDTKITKAIDDTHKAIKEGMTDPFRDHLNDAGVDAAMAACAHLSETLAEILPLLDNTDYDFTGALNDYAYKVVVPTYKAMKDAARDMYEKAKAYKENPTQTNLDKVCEAWKMNRIPWEQSEAFLFGPAEVLGLDPSLDSWPLDQDAIWGILKNIKSGATVDQVIKMIQTDEVRGFHTIELLLFKDGSNRKVN